ncbi:winged helix-turn-helix domain-containing protein [Halococcus thailandensis]|uniref:ArsR family transcriptional regulator n=1 Tax=Halococcus thailandensis JCM 13552 TaxID=1227457 RepID=M0N5Y0_9EURY|nr:winged helix-turn-helix domain-containing protein [Halococcus thailandensis]EMA52085.1 hypothetical protein C451_12292 [Halococcus thailandensis JCM 13552]
MTDTSSEVELTEIRNAFQLLANETRLSILYALWTRPAWEATFTELKTAVGMRDSGQFQYHLNQLMGTFIQRTDEGYTHLAGGIALYRAVLGTLGGPDDVPQIVLETPCPLCHGSLVLSYENQVFYARCKSCDETVLSSPFFPAGVVNRTDQELLMAFDAWSRRLIDLLQSGVCPWCASTVSHDFERSGDPEEVLITHQCTRCEGFLTTHVGEVFLSDPAVISFFYLLGRDVTTIPYWSFEFCTDNDDVAVLSENPWMVEQAIRYEGETIRLRLDETMNTTVADCSINSLSNSSA